MKSSYTAVRALTQSSSEIFTVLCIIPDISNLDTFIGDETGYIPHYTVISHCSVSGFLGTDPVKIMTSFMQEGCFFTLPRTYVFLES